MLCQDPTQTLTGPYPPAPHLSIPSRIMIALGQQRMHVLAKTSRSRLPPWKKRRCSGLGIGSITLLASGEMIYQYLPHAIKKMLQENRRMFELPGGASKATKKSSKVPGGNHDIAPTSKSLNFQCSTCP